MSGEQTFLARVQRAVLQNIGLKTFSLLVSIGLFTVVHGSESGQRSIHVPVVALLPPQSSGKILVNEIPDKVKVTMSGSRSVLDSISTIDSVQIDLTKAERYYHFDPDVFGLPSGIDVQVTPPSLTLQWESLLERSVPVRVQLSGAVNPSYELVGKPAVVPPQVKITGPRSVVESMSEVLTEPVPITDLTEGTHRRRAFLLPLPKHVTVSPGMEVTAEITLEAKRAQRRLRRLFITPVGVGGTVSVRPLHVDVVVAAPERVLEELDPEHVVPVVDLAGIDLSSNVVSVPVTLRGLAEGVRVIRIEPSEVLVRAR